MQEDLEDLDMELILHIIKVLKIEYIFDKNTKLNNV
jgi:hypothetical protein